MQEPQTPMSNQKPTPYEYDADESAYTWRDRIMVAFLALLFIGGLGGTAAWLADPIASQLTWNPTMTLTAFSAIGAALGRALFERFAPRIPLTVRILNGASFAIAAAVGLLVADQWPDARGIGRNVRRLPFIALGVILSVAVLALVHGAFDLRRRLMSQR